MSSKHLQIQEPAQGSNRYRVLIKKNEVENHLNEHIFGAAFLNPLSAMPENCLPNPFIVGASDVSQHRSAVPVPSRFFKRSVPFVLNNAAGTIFGGIQDGVPHYDNVFNPKPDDALLRWMLIDPSYQEELEPQDYERCIASAMDVGQYKFDLDYLLKRDERVPHIIFRDGSLFPQDAYLDNFVLPSRRGEFAREAIREFLNCLLYAREQGTLYCGVSKNVMLKLYSAVVDWFIGRYIDSSWETGNYVLNDGQAMTLLLSSPEFVSDPLETVVATCLIKRSFTTRAALNEKLGAKTPEEYFKFYEQQHPSVNINPYKSLCDIAHLVLFYMGHSKSPQQQLPRYEFFQHGELNDATEKASQLLAALRLCTFMADKDHSYMADVPVTYLMPSVTQQAHDLSKQVGKYIDTATGQWIMARYKNLLSKAS